MKDNHNISMSSLIKELVMEGLKVKAFKTRDNLYNSLLKEMKTEFQNKSNPVEKRIEKVLSLDDTILKIGEIEIGNIDQE